MIMGIRLIIEVAAVPFQSVKNPLWNAARPTATDDGTLLDFAWQCPSSNRQSGFS